MIQRFPGVGISTRCPAGRPKECSARVLGPVSGVHPPSMGRGGQLPTQRIVEFPRKSRRSSSSTIRTWRVGRNAHLQSNSRAQEHQHLGSLFTHAKLYTRTASQDRRRRKDDSGAPRPAVSNLYVWSDGSAWQVDRRQSHSQRAPASMAFHSSGLSLREPPRCSLPGASPMRCPDGRMTASQCSIMTPQLCMPSCQ